MHSATLDTAAAILLLSSIGSMGLLVKRTPKSRFASSASVLSISDILSSVLTALIVLLHHFFMNNDHSWNDEVKKEDYAKFTYHLSKGGENHFGVNSTEFSKADAYETNNCDWKSVLFQYAMFFIPFINAFLSLVNLSFNCYTNAKEIDKRCCRLTCAQSDAEKNESVTEGEIENEKIRLERKLSNIRQKFTGSRIFQQRYKGLALLSQWLLPALFTGTFQLGERRAVELAPTRPGEDLLCVVAANFPFEDCPGHVEFGEKISGTLHDFLSSEDDLLRPHPNASEVDDVLKRVYGVVQAVLNDTVDPDEREDYFNVTQLLDVVNHTRATEDTELLLRLRMIQRRAKEYYGNPEGADDYFRSNFLKSLNENENEKPQLTECMKNRCVMSVRFLKIYLFLLLVLIYFAPILLSSLLLVVSYYKCREAARKLKEVKTAEDKIVQNVGEAPGDGESSKEGWFSVQVGDSSIRSRMSLAKVEESTCELICEADRMQGFFRIFKMNAVLAVVLWTPFFFQIISKVFFCSRVPNWLIEVSFLATVIFAVFRNAVNLSVVRMEADAENYKKNNSVHPNS